MVLSPPAPPSRSRDPCPHPTAAAPAPPGARPCQNTSPVPEPKAVGAAAPQLLTVSVVQDGDRGRPGLGAGSCEGLGARWGTARPRWAAHGDTGACAMAGPWGWSAAAPGCVWGSSSRGSWGRGQPGSSQPPRVSCFPHTLQRRPRGSPFISILGPPGSGVSHVPNPMGSPLPCGVQTLARGASHGWVRTLLPLALSWAAGSGRDGCAPSPPLSPGEPLHLIGFVFT